MDREPAVIIGALESAAIAIIGVAAYLLAWEPDLTALVITAASAIVALVGSVIIRSRVTPA